jgi:zinc transporter, ZIP family
MPDALQQFLPYLLAAAGAGVVGGGVAFFWSPGVHARGAVQHFAAGVVIAAVASDLIPEAERTGSPLGILGGFAAGGLAMMVLKWVVLKVEKPKAGGKPPPFGIAAAAAADTLLDGAIISAGFAATQRLGSLLAIALAIELFFLTLSVGAEFHKQKARRWQGLAATTGIALLLLVGAVTTFFLLRGASEATVAVVLAFGAAALIYLIAEELLVESIQAEESLFTTAMLFAGFLVVLALKLLGEGKALAAG